MHERAVAFPGVLFCYASSCIPTIQWLDAMKLVCGICLSFRVALGDRLTSFNSHWCYSISFLLRCTLELSTESCCLATEYDLLTESAISLSCLLQDYFDVCHGPIIQIIAIIRMLRDLLCPLSAFVHLSLNFTENEKLSIYWDTILHVQEKPKMYTSC